MCLSYEKRVHVLQLNIAVLVYMYDVHKHIFPAVYMQSKPHSWLHRAWSDRSITKQQRRRQQWKAKQRKRKKICIVKRQLSTTRNKFANNKYSIILLSAPCIDNIYRLGILIYTHHSYEKKLFFHVYLSLLLIVFTLLLYFTVFTWNPLTHTNQHRYTHSITSSDLWWGRKVKRNTRMV